MPTQSISPRVRMFEPRLVTAKARRHGLSLSPLVIPRLTSKGNRNKGRYDVNRVSLRTYFKTKAAPYLWGDREVMRYDYGIGFGP